MSEISGSFDTANADRVPANIRSAAARVVYRTGGKTRRKRFLDEGGKRIVLSPQDEREILDIMGILPMVIVSPGSCRECDRQISSSDLGIGKTDICSSCHDRMTKPERKSSRKPPSVPGVRRKRQGDPNPPEGHADASASNLTG
jgi:hypothetical protein